MTFKEFKNTETFNLIENYVCRYDYNGEFGTVEGRIPIKVNSETGETNVDRWEVAKIGIDVAEDTPKIAICLKTPTESKEYWFNNLTMKEFFEMGMGNLFPNGFDIKDYDIDEDDPENYIESVTDVENWKVIQIGCNPTDIVPVIFVQKPTSSEE